MKDILEAPAVTDCDPECKWRNATEVLTGQHDAERESVPTAPYMDNEDDIRPTKEGYAQLDVIEGRYAGISLICSIGENCTRACAIERYAFPHDGDVIRPTFGPDIKAAFNDLKGK